MLIGIKKILKSILFEFVYGGHLASIATIGLILSVVMLMNLEFNILLVIIPYLITQIVYGYNHLRERKADEISNPERVSHLENNNKRAKIVFIFYNIILTIVLFWVNIQTNILIFFIILGGVLYTDFLKKYGNKHLVGFKNICTSFFGAVSIFIVPLFYEVEVTTFVVGLFFFIFMRWIVNSMFFDLKDIAADKKEGIKTFPVVFGKTYTLFFLIIINFFSLIPLFLGIYLGNYSTKYYFLGIYIIYSFIYLLVAFVLNRKQLRLFSYVFVDAEDFIWFLVVILFKSLIL